MSDQKQVVITQADLDENRYVFGKDVVTSAMTGVSKSGSAEAESGKPASKFKARYHYESASLQMVMGSADYKHGVNLRASLRGGGKKPAWIPEPGTKVDVLVTNGGKVDIKTLPAAIQAEMLFGSIEDPVTKKRAIKAFLSAL